MYQFKNSWVRWLGCLTLLCGITLCAHAKSDQTSRAIWMWEAASFAMLEDHNVATENIAFMKEKGINVLYLYADAFQGVSKIRTQRAQYRHLIKRLHQEGFQVYALLGSWYLNTHRYVLPSERAKAHQMFQRVLDYNGSVTPVEKFDGINLDIEPHILDEWDTHKIELLEQWIALSHEFMQLKRQSKQTLQVGPAIPFWLDGIQTRWNGQIKPTSEHLQDIYDYVALMNYRDRAEGRDGMIRHAENEMAYAQVIGKTVVIGLETGPNEIQKVSFHHLRELDMARELGLVQGAYGKQSAFGGFVIHHFETYRKWVSQSESVRHLPAN